MKYARLVDSVAVDVVSTDPAETFHPDIAAEFVKVPDEVEVGWRLDGDEWLPGFTMSFPGGPAEPPAPRRILQVSPPTFLLLFTSQERIAIRAARRGGVEPIASVLDDWFSIIEDPRLQYVDLSLQATKDGIDFLVGVGLLPAERAAEIKQGVAA